MLGAMAAYAVNDALVKASTQALPPGQVLAVRGVFATAFAGILARGAVHTPLYRPLRRPIVAVRCLLEIATAFTSVLALARAPLAVVAAVMMAAPLLIGLGTALLGWEPWRGMRIGASLIGFAGVITVLRPWDGAAPGGTDVGVFWAFLCAASLAARDLVTRRLPRDLPSVHVALLTTAAVCLAGLVLGLFEHWAWPGPRAWGLLALAACFTATGNLALIAACRNTDLAVVTPFRYSMVVWSVLLGALVWHELPDLLTLLGIALICGAGLRAARQGTRA